MQFGLFSAFISAFLCDSAVNLCAKAIDRRGAKNAEFRRGSKLHHYRQGDAH
jgi:hypothetical protein